MRHDRRWCLKGVSGLQILSGNGLARNYLGWWVLSKLQVHLSLILQVPVQYKYTGLTICRIVRGGHVQERNAAHVANIVIRRIDQHVQGGPPRMLKRPCVWI